jgi:DNA-binding NarL/FixJ family response regulator
VTDEPQRVVVVEDHPIFRDGLVRCLDAEPDLTVVGQLVDATFPVRQLVDFRPDVVVMDIELPGGSGIDATRRIHSALPEVPVVILTAFLDQELLFAAMQAGARGYVLKHMSFPELLATLRRVLAGETLLTPALASRVLREFESRQVPGRDPRLSLLSPREEEVLRLLATGETNRQIARRLFVSEETIKSHVGAILRKLEVPDRTRAAVLAARAGLLDG